MLVADWKLYARYGHLRWARRVVLAFGLVAVLVSGIAAAQAHAAVAHAATSAFVRGDVFLTDTAGVQEFSPSGQLRQTLPGTATASNLCFDPAGRYLILPGVGLFDSSGSLVASAWASIAPGRCVADGNGNVYVRDATAAGTTITKYGIHGAPLRTFTVAPNMSNIAPLSLDLAPDACSIDYGAWLGGINSFNVCTNTQGTAPTPILAVDDVRVLPNWQLLIAQDGGAQLLDSSGVVRSYPVPIQFNGEMRAVSLDPDGTSFWLGGAQDAGVFRFDLSSGTQLAHWTPASGTAMSGEIAVYAPPLLGDPTIRATVDSDAPGTAEAFPATGRSAGHVTALHLYVDASSTASRVVVGIYTNHNGQPGTLRSHATLESLRPGSWNSVDVPSTSVTAGQRYWIALLGPRGGGMIAFRDAAGSGHSQTSGQSKLTTLPAQWSPGQNWNSAALSAYGS